MMYTNADLCQAALIKARDKSRFKVFPHRFVYLIHN